MQLAISNRATRENGNPKPGNQTPQGIEALMDGIRQPVFCHPDPPPVEKDLTWFQEPESFVALSGFSALVAKEMKMNNPLLEQSGHQARARATIPPKAGLEPETRNPEPGTRNTTTLNP